MFHFICHLRRSVLLVLVLVSAGHELQGCDNSPPPSITRACLIDEDCPERFLCLDERCTASMADNPDLMPGGPCVSDWECVEGELCDVAVRTCFTPQCSGLQDCELGRECIRGRCEIDVTADRDRDGVPDEVDNCPTIINTDQDDLDDDGQGNLCDEDIDGDGVESDPEGTGVDNCPKVRNPGQGDFDEDGIGNLCDEDQDNDGVPNYADNCIRTVNPGQEDWDFDGIGDACSLDVDQDGVSDLIDNCMHFNPSQSDLDGDELGNLCDDDIDGDGINNDEDNCIYHHNITQADADADGVGDLCSNDYDGDGVLNGEDNCERTPNPLVLTLNAVGVESFIQPDLDVDGQGDECDPDLDGDGIINGEDNCPKVYNEPELLPDGTRGAQADLDENGVGDACDPDLDGDGSPQVDDQGHAVDNCPRVPNDQALDLDGDGVGDACDPDRDGDGIPNVEDVCPDIADTTQGDYDGDGIGDVCDEDRDGDGIPNRDDSCPFVSNDQAADLDGDGIGDRCDPDLDGDGLPNISDNCPNVPNPDQVFYPNTPIGVACAVDRDGDGVFDPLDNCPEVLNSEQRDFDGDGQGDACDLDDDGDGILDEDDSCPYLQNPDQQPDQESACEADLDSDGLLNEEDFCPLDYDESNLDTDEDGIGDVCDDDLDGDEVINALDNCPRIDNDQVDRDQDGLGDACDSDMDGDQINNGLDNCPQIANLDQRDSNFNNIGDICEQDPDRDGIINAFDNCPDTPILDQSDLDGDGIGDACDTDIDGDGIPNELEKDGEGVFDNCIGTYNPLQELGDDGVYGALCRDDHDGDGILNDEDNCPEFPNQNQADLDGDDLGDHCDDDQDGDGALDQLDDFCPLISTESQVDLDGDGLGDPCDPDRDGDQIPDFDSSGEPIDNCPDVQNPDQTVSALDPRVGRDCAVDSDGDGVLDPVDNCPQAYNTLQLDFDQDGFGDACDEDDDNDGQLDLVDTCPFRFDQDLISTPCLDRDNDALPNDEDPCPDLDTRGIPLILLEADVDDDGIPDLCDPDMDGDGYLNDEDNCPSTFNDQSNRDGDSLGDSCDFDLDGDGWPNDIDNCPIAANENQADFDGDGVGDLCELDRDVDGIPDVIDTCPGLWTNVQSDFDRDGLGDLCDPDMDGDGINNESDTCPYSQSTCDPNDLDGDGIRNPVDNCPRRRNADQRDLDDDGLGDVCDPDLDGDGHHYPQAGSAQGSLIDNCPGVANPSQLDSDRNGRGDACEADTDGDGIPDPLDNCVFISNFTQQDTDDDQRGDHCDPDIDGDGVANFEDNCRFDYNPNQENLDRDLERANGGPQLGDLCDADLDEDGVLNQQDNCPTINNLDQADVDVDGTGDVCDPDPNDPNIPRTGSGDNGAGIGGSGGGTGGSTAPPYLTINPADDLDSDLIPDLIDNCPTVPNPNQEDIHGDGLGLACHRVSDVFGELLNITHSVHDLWITSSMRTSDLRNQFCTDNQIGTSGALIQVTVSARQTALVSLVDELTSSQMFVFERSPDVLNPVECGVKELTLTPTQDQDYLVAIVVTDQNEQGEVTSLNVEMSPFKVKHLDNLSSVLFSPINEGQATAFIISEDGAGNHFGSLYRYQNGAGSAEPINDLGNPTALWSPEVVAGPAKPVCTLSGQSLTCSVIDISQSPPAIMGNPLAYDTSSALSSPPDQIDGFCNFNGSLADCVLALKGEQGLNSALIRYTVDLSNGGTANFDYLTSRLYNNPVQEVRIADFDGDFNTIELVELFSDDLIIVELDQNNSVFDVSSVLPINHGVVGLIGMVVANLIPNANGTPAHELAAAYYDYDNAEDRLLVYQKGGNTSIDYIGNGRTRGITTGDFDRNGAKDILIASDSCGLGGGSGCLELTTLSSIENQWISTTKIHLGSFNDPLDFWLSPAPRIILWGSQANQYLSEVTISEILGAQEPLNMDLTLVPFIDQAHLADLDQDGDLDALIRSGDKIYALRQTPEGFMDFGLVNLGGIPASDVIFADVNGDLLIDIVSIQNLAQGVQVRLGQDYNADDSTRISWANPQSFGVGEATELPAFFVAANLNEDLGDELIWIRAPDGAGSMAGVVYSLTNGVSAPSSAAIVNLNTVGTVNHLEVIPRAPGHPSRLSTDRGVIHFENGEYLATTSLPYCVDKKPFKVGDLDRDTLQDVLCVDDTGSLEIVWGNNASPSLIFNELGENYDFSNALSTFDPAPNAPERFGELLFSGGSHLLLKYFEDGLLHVELKDNLSASEVLAVALEDVNLDGARDYIYVTQTTPYLQVIYSQVETRNRPFGRSIERPTTPLTYLDYDEVLQSDGSGEIDLTLFDGSRVGYLEILMNNQATLQDGEALQLNAMGETLNFGRRNERFNSATSPLLGYLTNAPTSGVWRFNKVNDDCLIDGSCPPADVSLRFGSARLDGLSDFPLCTSRVSPPCFLDATLLPSVEITLNPGEKTGRLVRVPGRSISHLTVSDTNGSFISGLRAELQTALNHRPLNAIVSRKVEGLHIEWINVHPTDQILRLEVMNPTERAITSQLRFIVATTNNGGAN